MAFHLDLSGTGGASSTATRGASGSSRSLTPVPLLDSPASDPTLAPYSYSQSSAHSHPINYHRTSAGEAVSAVGPYDLAPTRGLPPPPAPPVRHQTANPYDFASPAASAADSGPTRSASGRAKGPPMRSTTMDDAYYVGPGEPSAVTRGKAPVNAGIYGAIGTGQSLVPVGHCSFLARAPRLRTPMVQTEPAFSNRVEVGGEPQGSLTSLTQMQTGLRALVADSMGLCRAQLHRERPGCTAKATTRRLRSSNPVRPNCCRRTSCPASIRPSPHRNRAGLPLRHSTSPNCRTCRVRTPSTTSTSGSKTCGSSSSSSSSLP